MIGWGPGLLGVLAPAGASRPDLALELHSTLMNDVRAEPGMAVMVARPAGRTGGRGIGPPATRASHRSRCRA